MKRFFKLFLIPYSFFITGKH